MPSLRPPFFLLPFFINISWTFLLYSHSHTKRNKALIQSRGNRKSIRAAANAATAYVEPDDKIACTAAIPRLMMSAVFSLAFQENEEAQGEKFEGESGRQQEDHQQDRKGKGGDGSSISLCGAGPAQFLAFGRCVRSAIQGVAKEAAQFGRQSGRQESQR